jgi:hypothetical protein
MTFFCGVWPVWPVRSAAGFWVKRCQAVLVSAFLAVRPIIRRRRKQPSDGETSRWARPTTARNQHSTADAPADVAPLAAICCHLRPSAALSGDLCPRAGPCWPVPHRGRMLLAHSSTLRLWIARQNGRCPMGRRPGWLGQGYFDVYVMES